MNKDIQSLLTQLGLTDTEAAIYQTGLSYNYLGVRELEKQTKIKRPTIYHALSTLTVKGLVSKKSIGNRNLFQMANPESLQTMVDQELEQLQQKKQTIASLIPLFASPLARTDTDVQVEHYEGIAGIKQIIEAALYCRSHKWDILAPRKNFFSEFDKEYAAYYLSKRKERNIQSRTIWEPYPSAKKRILTEEEKRDRQPRYLPESMLGTFSSVIIIFDDAVAIISSFDSLNGILIRSKEIQSTMKTMFEGLWTVSTPYDIFVADQKNPLDK